ncbi:MAG: N-acetyltransferase family protein [Candidatus Velamenicoccus archaeovorus]
MENNTSCVIRKYIPNDRPAVRRISVQTALMGDPGTVFFDDDETLADALTIYFTDHEPGSCFVAVCGGKVAGYVLGATDVRRMDKIFGTKILPFLLPKAFRRGTFLCRKNLRFLFHVFLSLLKGEFRTPVFSEEYPAALHINIDKEFRALGIGSKLIHVYLDYLKKEGVAGVHFATMSEKAAGFFEKNGFRRLFSGKRSYFRYFLGRDVLLAIYGMRLAPAKAQVCPQR